jgi:Uma2 family endonuclease
MAKSATAVRRRTPARREAGRPTWEIAQLVPEQGDWTEEDYLNLESVYGEDIHVEVSDGWLEVLPVPTKTHQLILAFFYELLRAFTVVHAPGLVLFTGTRVKLSTKGKRPRFREPDVLYMKEENLHRCLEEYWVGGDLLMEVVSGDAKDRERDLVTKPREYAAARVPEYWIIHPEEKFIRVLTLRGRSYRLHGEFGPGMQATSALLPGFSVSVDAVLAAGAGKRKG